LIYKITSLKFINFVIGIGVHAFSSAPLIYICASFSICMLISLYFFRKIEKL